MENIVIYKELSFKRRYIQYDCYFPLDITFGDESSTNEFNKTKLYTISNVS